MQFRKILEGLFNSPKFIEDKSLFFCVFLFCFVFPFLAPAVVVNLMDYTKGSILSCTTHVSLMSEVIGKARDCKSKGRKKGKKRAPRVDLHYRRERAKRHLDLLNIYVLRSNSTVPDLWY